MLIKGCFCEELYYQSVHGYVCLVVIILQSAFNTIISLIENGYRATFCLKFVPQL